MIETTILELKHTLSNITHLIDDKQELVKVMTKVTKIITEKSLKKKKKKKKIKTKKPKQLKMMPLHPKKQIRIPLISISKKKLTKPCSRLSSLSTYIKLTQTTKMKKAIGNYQMLIMKMIWMTKKKTKKKKNIETNLFANLNYKM